MCPPRIGSALPKPSRRLAMVHAVVGFTAEPAARSRMSNVHAPAWLFSVTASVRRGRHQPPPGPSGLGGGRIDDRPDLHDVIRGETRLLRVLPDVLLAGRDVHAVDRVVRDETLDPLHLWAELRKHVAGPLRCTPQLFRRHAPGPRYLASDQVLRHGLLLA